MKTLFKIIALSFSVFALLLAKEKDGAASNTAKRFEKAAAYETRYGVLSINNLSTWHRYDGQSNHSPTSIDGMFYPKGRVNVIYQDNIVWAGKMFTNAALTTPAASQPVRVSGGSYGVGTKAGNIIGSGATATAAAISSVRAWRIRRDHLTASRSEIAQDAASVYEISISSVTDGLIDEVLAQYKKDWEEWPVDLGAPYVDRNNNGKYDKPANIATMSGDALAAAGFDEPGIAGIDPNSPGDQVIYIVYNDLDKTQVNSFVGSDPTGIEVQKTVWAYKRTDAMGNLYFSRYRFINKGGVDVGGGTKGSFWIDSMYICQWSDPDLGSAGDDLAGSDSARSLGYVYNGNASDASFTKYGLAPAASGYDFLQGPLVNGAAGDTGIFKFKKIAGKKNLGMSSFAYFSAGSNYSDPPTGASNYLNGSGRWWKMLRGFAPLGDMASGDTRYNAPPGVATSFPLGGDPVTGTGFIDGQGTAYSFAPGDRRILLNTGPFSMAPGDTQEVVIGTLAGLGADRKSSISVLKSNDNAVQLTYNLLFQVTRAPASPRVQISELDGKVMLEWGSNLAQVKATETTVSQPGNFTFEGYNIYQFPSSTSQLSDAKRIATYDVVNGRLVIFDTAFVPSLGAVTTTAVQFGSDAGVKRFFEFNKDYIQDINKLYNGKEYYLAVTAYSVTPDVGYTAALESSPNILTVRPQKPFGSSLPAIIGDTLKITKEGSSDGKLIPIVISPTKLTGDKYEVRWDSTGYYKIINSTKNIVLASGLTNETADDKSTILDGIMWKIVGAPYDVKNFQHVAGPTGAINPPSYASFAFNSWGFPPLNSDALGTGTPINDRPTADWGGGTWGIHTGGAGAANDESYKGRFVPRVFRNDNFSRFVPYDFEIRFTAAGGKAFLAFTTEKVIDVPFELWNIGINTPNDPSDDFRMIPWLNDADGDGKFNLNKTDHALSGSDNDPYTDWIYWMNPEPRTPGSAGYNAFVAADTNYKGVQGTGSEVMARMVLVNFNGGSISDATWPANVTSTMPKTGNVIRILSTKPNGKPDIYTVNTATYKAINDQAAINFSLSKVGVYPNPYYAFNPLETNRFERFVTFNNLPINVTMRIFNLAGQLVKIIKKSDNSTFAKWNLLNQDDIPVASGLYIVHLDFPDQKQTKILKVSIIQEQEIFDTY